MTHLSLVLLGPIQASLGGQPLTPFKYDKVGALLAYLAVDADRPHTRQALLGLLWPDLPEDAARNNLRQALINLREAIGDRTATPSFLLSNRATLQFNRESHYQLDVSEFVALLDGCDHHIHRHPTSCKACAQYRQQAVDLYHGDFLAEFFLPASAAFEEWALSKRAWLQQRVLNALNWLTCYHERRSQYNQALGYARRQLELDPWSEEIHRQIMRLYALNNDRSAALAQYDKCRHILAVELDVKPEEETFALFEQIRDAFETKPLAPNLLALPSTRPHTLAPPLTSFIGREVELAEISRLLDQPACRLLTLTGPGGIGKTRLALKAAADHVDDFADGVVFVSLVGVTAGHFLPHAILAALGVPPQSQQPPDEQLRAILHQQEILLVLDNYEQLLPEMEVLIQIIRSAPGVVLLVTSRERLAIQAEWLFALDGLSYPDADKDEKWDESESVQLFVQRVDQVQRGFMPTADERKAISRICQMVEGMPLALELAAATVREQSCVTIATELEHDQAVIATRLRDLPDRHRSMEAVFEHSWNLLSVAEQDVLRSLSLFRGGFTRAAAEQVAGASNLLLNTLADKSFIQYDRGRGRYALHELLRQYAAKQLSAADEHNDTGARFLHYYLQLAETAEPHLRGIGRAEWMTALVSEHDNLRLAFEWACTKGRPEQALCLAGALLPYWVAHGAWVEGAHCITTALALQTAEIATDTDLRALAKVLYGAGLFAWNQSDYVRAKACTDKSLRLFERLADDFESAKAYHLLGLTARAQRDFAQATLRFSTCLDLARKCDDKLLMATVLNDMGLVAWRQSDFVKANTLYEESLAYFQEEQDAHGVARNLFSLGLVACWQADLERARTFVERSLTGFRQLADPFYIAQALGVLGIATFYQNELDKAQSLFEETLDCYRTLNAQRSIGITLLRLGHVQRRKGNIVVAGQLYSEATVLLRRIGDRLNLVHALEAWFYLAVSHRKLEAAARLGGTTEAWRERLGTPRPPIEIPEYDQHITAVRTILGEPLFDIAWAEGRQMSMDQAFDDALSR